MRFDLFFEIARPPFVPRTEREAIEDTIGDIVLADRLGFGCAWVVEHHLFGGYSHSSKPEIVLAAAARETSLIRLGLGVVPLPYHHPVHVAETIGMLDNVSGGRLEVGIGRGFSPQEYRLFGVEMAESRERTAESLALLRRYFAGSPVTFHGQHFNVEAADLLPRPLQTPHPPLWTAAVSPETFEWAAQEAIGVLAGPFKPWFMVRADVARYREHWSHDEPPRIGMTIGMLCLRNRDRARTQARDAFTWFFRELLRTTGPVLERVWPSYAHFAELGRFRHAMRAGIRLPMLESLGMAVVGTPQECVERLANYRKAGVTHMLLAVGAGAVETAIVRESLACLAEDVLPHFRG